jgi:transposase
VNARDGLVRDRTALKNREKNLTITLLKRQAKQRLEQIARQIEAIDTLAQEIILADPELARRQEIIASISGLGIQTAAQLIATMPALIAARYNPDLKAKYKQLTSARKPAKVALTAIMRKLIVMANVLLRENRNWTPERA